MRVCYKKEIIDTAQLYVEATSLVDFDSTSRENIRAFFQLMRHCCEGKGERIGNFLQRQRDIAERIILFA